MWKIPSADRFLPAPRGLYSDAQNTVYVLDNAGRVLVYDSDGNLWKRWNMPDSRIGKPEGIWRLQDGRSCGGRHALSPRGVFQLAGRGGRDVWGSGAGPW
ncbi:MAG UNVERIFIED_CONTAM: hypothetical protein LVR18_50720 [Planctomycetaceae bacterium]